MIPSYKNRVGNLVQHLEQVSDNKIYVFVYADDYDNYKDYDCKPNVEFVKLNVNWRSIQKKRRYIQDYFAQRPDIERYIMIDDDVKGCRINNNGKTENIDLKSALATLEELHTKYGKGTVSGTEFNNLAFAHATKIVKQNPFYQVFLFDNDWVIEHPECRFRNMDLKTVMDKELPNWENLERSFTVPQYQSCFYKIDQIVKEKLQKPMSTLGDFLQ